MRAGPYGAGRGIGAGPCVRRGQEGGLGMRQGQVGRAGNKGRTRAGARCAGRAWVGRSSGIRAGPSGRALGGWGWG